MTRNRVLGLAAAVLAGIGIVVGTFIAGSRDNGSSAVAEALPERAISVSGHGEVLIQPDVAVLQVGVSVLDESVAAARERAATAMDKVLASVKGNGVADDDIQTTSFSIQPEYDYSDNTAKLRGFRVFNSVSIKIRKLDSASKVIDDAVAAGGDDAVVNGISFEVEDSKAAIKKARELAMADARDKAEQLATLGSVTLGDPISINESGGYAPPPVYYEEAMRSAAPAGGPTPVQPGQLSVSVDVGVSYAIK